MASTAATTLNPKLIVRHGRGRRHHHHHHHHHHHRIVVSAAACRNMPPWDRPDLALRLRRPLLAVARATASDGGGAEANPKPWANEDIEVSSSNVSSREGYIGLFVAMLGLDNDPLDREQAVVTLWNYSQGGKDCVDGIMQFSGCINLVVSLLKSDSCFTCEAAAGLLRNVSSVSLYRDIVAKSGAIEELTGLLCQPTLTPEVKEQSLCTLWNLSTDEKISIKLANNDFLPKLIKFLDDEKIKVKDAAGGILANLSLSPCNHNSMVEAGVIPKLADLLKSNNGDFKVIRREAKTALLELSKDDYYRILINEEGLVRVPLVGADAYKSFRPLSYSWPTLPDGTELQKIPRPSRYGASELLLGLNINEKEANLEEAKMNAIVGRSHQQFLARIGVIELEDERESQLDSLVDQRYTLLPWVDGVARLVLILGLEDVSAITRAAHAIADASISEHMRISFKEAGAVRSLVQLLSHNTESIQEAVAHALERLCVSYEVCQVSEAEGVLNPLVNILKNTNTSENMLEKTVNILSQIFDLAKYMKRKVEGEVVNGSKEMSRDTWNSHDMDGLTNSVDILSTTELMAREKIIDSGLISRLIAILRASSPNLQIKVSSILEYIATFEEHGTTIVTSGIESGIDAVLQQVPLGGMEGEEEYELDLDAIKAEEIALAIAAAARLLTKLLNLEHFCRNIDAAHFALMLQKILRSNISLSAKNWIAACLVKLEFLVGRDMGHGRPISMEVTLYETIPRLVEQMRTAFSYDSQEAAVLELNEIISRGGVECTRAVADAGGIFPLVKLIEEGSGDALEASLAILYNLSMDEENHSAIVAAGAVPVLRRIVLSERPQWTHALHLLRTLPT